MKLLNKVAVEYFILQQTQDGNFRAGEQFLVEQATGIITLNSACLIFPGLQSLTLGGVVIGGTAVVINEFSKEQTFIANSIILCLHKELSQHM